MTRNSPPALTAPARGAAEVYRYNKAVFVTPNWEEIYQNDSERTMTFDEAQRFGESIKTTYRDLGYDLVELPCDSPERRAEIILARIRVDSTERQ